MPYVRRFYYLPRVLPKESEALVPCQHLWKFECTVLNSILDEHKPTCGSQNSFQDLPNEEQIKQLRYKKILGTLNKMTPKKFQKLILEMGLECVDVTYVKMLAEVIFSKALIDELYVNLYAKLCEEILSILPSESHHYFKQTLVDLCETGFDQLLNITVDDLIYLKEDKRYTCKRKLMTMMRFIGEMSCLTTPLFSRSYNWKMVERLIDKGDELHLEAVYFLLFTISLRSANNSWPEYLWLIVAKLARGVGPKGESVSSRIRFMFLSTVEARIGILPPDQLPIQTTPSTSDSECNEQVQDFKGF